MVVLEELPPDDEGDARVGMPGLEDDDEVVLGSVGVALGADGSVLGAGARKRHFSARRAPAAPAGRDHDAWTSIADPEERAEVERQRGNDAFRKGRYEEATRHYTVAVDALEKVTGSGASPGKESAGTQCGRRCVLRCNRAQAHLRLGRFRDALNDCIDAAALDPGSVKAHYRAGAAAFGLGLYELALEWCAKAKALAPNDAAVLALHRRATAARLEAEGAADLRARAAAARKAHGTPQRHRNRLVSPEPALLVEALVGVLLDDDDNCEDVGGDADVESLSPADALEQLHEVLVCSTVARRYFAACRGYQAALQYIEVETRRVEAVVKAGGGVGYEEGANKDGSQAKARTGAAAATSETSWPSTLPGILARRAFSSGMSAGANASLAALLAWGSRDPAQRCGAYAERAEPGEEGTGGPCVLACRTLLSSEALSRTSVAAAEAAATMLRRFGEDSASRAALAACGCEPLKALLHCYSRCELLRDAKLHEGEDVPTSLANAESEEGIVKYMLRESERIYNPRLVALRRTCMAALATLMRDPALVRADAFDRRSNMMGQSKTVIGDLLPGLLAAVTAVELRSPRKSTVVLGLDQKPKAYEQRKYAADYEDNRSGDYIASITRDGTPDFTHSEGTTVIEFALSAVLAAANIPSAARALHASGVHDLLRPFCEWATPSVVSTVERIYARLAVSCEGLVADMLDVDTSAVPLGGLILSSSSRLKYRGMRRVATIIDTMPGNDFNHLARKDGALMAVWTILQQGATVQGKWNSRNEKTDGVPEEGSGLADVHLEAAARQVFVLSVDRARGPGGGLHPPRGGCWDQMGYEALLDMESAITRRPWRKSGLAKPAAAAALTARATEAVKPAGLPALAEQASASSAAATPAGGAAPAKKASELAKDSLSGKPKVKAASAARAAAPSAANDDKEAGSIKTGFFGGPKRRVRDGERRRQRVAGRAAGGGKVDTGAIGAETVVAPAGAAPSPAAESDSAVPHVHAPTPELDAIDGVGAGDAAKASASTAAHTAAPVVRPWFLDMRDDIDEMENEQSQAAVVEAGGAAIADIVDEDADGTSTGVDGAYDEDGVRDVKGFDSRVPDALRCARNSWLNTPLHKKLRWNQGVADVHGYIQVPKGTRPRDLQVDISPTRLCVTLHWYGRVFDGPLKRRVKASEAVWTLEDDEVHVALPKDDGYFWKSFYEGGEEKGHLEIYREIQEDEDSRKTWDEMTEEEKKSSMELQEIEQMYAEGLIQPGDIDDPTMLLGACGRGYAARALTTPRRSFLALTRGAVCVRVACRARRRRFRRGRRLKRRATVALPSQPIGASHARRSIHYTFIPFAWR